MERQHVVRVVALIDICRKHYAALIPEEMRDSVEFGRPTTGPDPLAGVSKALLDRLLKELAERQGPAAVEEKPRLRIVK